jgi:hypothetical protein
MRFGRSVWLAAQTAILVLGCATPTPTRPPPTRTPDETATPQPIQASPSPSPTPAVEASLHVDGMATVHLDDIPQVVDPAHPNHDRDLNEQLGTLTTGEQVFLVNQGRVKRDSYWQVARDSSRIGGPLGWIPQLIDGELTLDPIRPECPTAFPLSAADLAALGTLAALSCFGNSELTLSGTVSCQLEAVGEFAVGGASYLDPIRSCDLDGELGLHGNEVTDLLDAPDVVDSAMGRYLVRGHFDDAQAQNCTSIPIGTDPSSAAGPPEPGPVTSCRQLFVVSTLTPLD